MSPNGIARTSSPLLTQATARLAVSLVPVLRWRHSILVGLVVLAAQFSIFICCFPSASWRQIAAELSIACREMLRSAANDPEAR